MPRLRRARASRSHHPRPSPHAATEKKQKPRAGLGRQRMAECGIAQSFVLRRSDRRPATPNAAAIARQRAVFFTATARSIVLGWTSRSNFFRISSASWRARMGSPSHRCSWIKPGPRPAPCADRADPASWAPIRRFPLPRSWPWSDSRSASTRRTLRSHSVTDAFSTDTRRSISYLTCTMSCGSKNSPSWNFGSRTFSGFRIQRALFDEGPDLGLLAVALGGHRDLRGSACRSFQ